MSFYARQMLNRPGPFGRSHDTCDAQRRCDLNNGGGGGIARFSQQKQPHRRNQNSQSRRPGFFRNEIIQGGVEGDEDNADNFPIEGSIHAQSQREDRNFSQVTLSQLSEGPSVRSVRSQHSLSHRSLAGGRDHRCGGGSNAPAPRDTNRSTTTTAIIPGNNGGVSGRGRVSNQNDRHFDSAPSGKQKQHLSQSLFHDADDANSLKSSQTLLSQYHRPSSNANANGDSKSRPSSSQSGVSSVKRTASRGSEYDIRQVSREYDDDDDDENNSILSSQPLLSVAENEPKSQRQPKLSLTPSLKPQQQISHQIRTPSCLPNLPSLREHGKRYSTGSTTIRTIGAISGTLASLPNPSQALRTMRSMAVRTSSSLVALTPFRKGRVQNTIGSSLGAPLLSSMRRSTAFAPTPKLSQSAILAVPKQFPHVSQVNNTPSVEHPSAHNMNSTSISNPYSTSWTVMPPSVAADDNQSKTTRTQVVTEPSNDRHTESASNLLLDTHAEGNDTNHANNSDNIIKVTNDSNRDLHDQAEEIFTATRELKHQLEQLEKSKEEFYDMSERARRQIKEEYAKLEALQQSMEVKYGALQTSMDTFSSTMVSNGHDHELTFRTLVHTSMNELRQESSRAVDAVSHQVHEQVKAQLPSGIRTLIETETRQHLLETIVGMVDSAKNDFQKWVSGVKNGCMFSGDGSESLNAFTSVPQNYQLGSVGENTIERMGAIGSMSTDGTVELSMNTAVQYDTANNQGACAHVGNPIVRCDTVDSQELVCELFTDALRQTDGSLKDETPTTSLLPNFEAAESSSYAIRVSKDTTPSCGHGEGSNITSLTPIPRGGMSTWTTPFSRKATPLKNNYAKNKIPEASSGQSRRDIVESKSDKELFLGKLSSPPLTPVQYPLVASSPETSCSLIAVSSIGSMAKVKVVRKASLNESLPAVKSATKESKPKTFGRSPNQALVNITSSIVNNAKDIVAIDKTTETTKVHLNQQGCEAKLMKKMKKSRKRDQSDVTEDTSISPRRSKRQREANRVKPMATQYVAGNCKPNRVTPKEDRTPVVACSYGWLDANRRDANSMEQRKSKSKGYDSLLGTSVTVPSTTHDSQDDVFLGLDDDDNMIMELSQPEKRSTLTCLLPFVNGFGYRSSAAIKSTKTFSKKRTKSKTQTAFDFDEFNFSS